MKFILTYNAKLHYYYRLANQIVNAKSPKLLFLRDTASVISLGQISFVAPAKDQD